MEHCCAVNRSQKIDLCVGADRNAIQTDTVCFEITFAFLNPVLPLDIGIVNVQNNNHDNKYYAVSIC
jgi:hypothetical protein